MRKKFCFSKFPLFNALASFDLNLLEKGWTKYFKNGPKSFLISHPLICTAYLLWAQKLIQMSPSDRGETWIVKLGNLISYHDWVKPLRLINYLNLHHVLQGFKAHVWTFGKSFLCKGRSILGIFYFPSVKELGDVIKVTRTGKDHLS